MKRGGKRYTALVDFKGEVRIVDDIRAFNLQHAEQLVAKRRETFFKVNQVPTFQQKTWRLLGLFYGSIRLATE